MMSYFRPGAWLAGGVLSLAIAGAAFADPAPPPPGPPAADHNAWPDPAQREADRAQRLSQILQPRPDQQDALHAFLAAVVPHEGMGDHGDTDHHDMDHDAQAMTTPERLDRLSAKLDEMRARMQSKIAATKAFYAQLTPPQQRAFDALGERLLRHFHSMDRDGDGDGRDHGPDGHDPDGGDRRQG